MLGASGVPGRLVGGADTMTLQRTLTALRFLALLLLAQRHCLTTASPTMPASLPRPDSAIKPAASAPLFGDDSALQDSGARPIWSPNATGQFVLLRRTFQLSADSKDAVATPMNANDFMLHVSAQPIPNRLGGPRHGGSLASKLLCAYKLWLNGVPVGAFGYPLKPAAVSASCVAQCL